MSYYAHTDFDPDAEPIDEAQLGLDRELASLDAEADRFEYLGSFDGGDRPLLVEAGPFVYDLPEAA